MATAPITLMNAAQRRRLLAGIVAAAIKRGDLPSDSVDFNWLLFGDPRLWPEFAKHAVVVETVAAAFEADAAQPLSQSRLRVAAAQALEDSIVAERDLTAARSNGARGGDAKDVEYKRLRARLDLYARFLLQRRAYQRMNQQLLEDYADGLEGLTTPAALAKAFRLPRDEVDDCIAEAESFIAVMKGTTISSLAPILGEPDKKRRKLALLRPDGGSTWRLRGSKQLDPAALSDDAHDIGPLSDERILGAAPADSLPRTPILDEFAVDHAVLCARVGLDLEADQAAALPTDWRDIRLEPTRIVELLPYPRMIRLDDALQAFGYPRLTAKLDLPPEFAEALEASAAPVRAKLLATANAEAPRWQSLFDVVPVPWKRAVAFYEEADRYSGPIEPGRGPVLRWEYLNAPRAGLYNARGRTLVEMLKVAIDVVDCADRHGPSEAWARVEILTETSAMHRRVVQAMIAGDRTQDVRVEAVETWLATLEHNQADIDLSGFKT